jgi:hypothetical protein
MASGVAAWAIFTPLQKQFIFSIFLVQIEHKECVLGNISYPKHFLYAPLYYSCFLYSLICQSGSECQVLLGRPFGYLQ